MWIVPNPLPRIKSFLQPAGLEAYSIRSDSRHCAAVKRFLTASEWANSSHAYQAVVAGLLNGERERKGKWVCSPSTRRT